MGYCAIHATIEPTLGTSGAFTRPISLEQYVVLDPEPQAAASTKPHATVRRGLTPLRISCAATPRRGLIRRRGEPIHLEREPARRFERAISRMRFLDDAFPLLVVMSEAGFDEGEMRAMVEGVEGYFRRNARFAVLSVSPGESVRMGARERKVLSDWVNSPRVSELSRRLCVGNSVVVPSAAARGALTAFLWFWTPPYPLRATATVEAGIDSCLERLTVCNVPLPRPAETLRSEIIGQLRGIGRFAPSFGNP